MIDNSKDKSEQCDSCGYPTEALKAYRTNRWDWSKLDTSDRSTHKWLCILCAGTMAGNAHEYPEQYPNKDVLSAVCYVGNAILEAIRGKP